MTVSTQDTGVPRLPVILMTPDLTIQPGPWSERQYVVRANYMEAIRKAGGVPLILPYEEETIDAALALADGVVITGTTPGVEVEPQRRDFERTLVGRVLDAGKPLLGICHGMQLIGELLGGTFVAALPKTDAEVISHKPSEIPDHLAHAVLLDPKSELALLLGETKTSVNSLHLHRLSGEGRFRVVARAPDGVIEAFEGLTPTFCLGVQWHPEYGLTRFDQAILQDFVARSTARHERL
ncbi:MULTISPECIES: gamma-glutamyl-gamma-aminobutyrate hydrolase family protein [Rhizobium]|uniref:Gamma-glutamyl-gamma-aminobutyrate hydrolase PuuD n=1 Tax=Rhizobium paranaense TaxID=1650438 RepID=A0A7W8XSA4_9HYPH|nr:gamma-glutamyl-gamma-aminobutyrate hydrolase family protein [Rhizobium paranaense]MBB5574672.1 gamma-glutamyl-gamma-aminobutyrate hydrolase PuuD [Rhizobium paranaense]